MSVMRSLFPALCCLALFPGLFMAGAHGQERHAIAMHGAPKYAAGFSHFEYVNPAAPKGGKAVFAAIGTFDSLNPLIIKGQAAAGLRAFVFESLMARSFDEPFSLYGLIAETIEIPPDRSWVAFKIRATARFSDGRPISVEDVIFSWRTLRDFGRPNHRAYYSKVVRVERPAPGIVRFVFGAAGDREIPLILGLMPIIPKHYFGSGKFEKTSLEKPIGSGPYVVEAVDAGDFITYKRNPGYWGRDLAVNRGRFNFDTMKYQYFRDVSAAFEAFKKGLIDVRGEGDPTRWATGYAFPAVRDGRVRRKTFKTGLPSGMSALVFNTRRPVFKDRKIRRALGFLFDFEWINKNLYFGQFQRTQSFFDNSQLSSHGRPAAKAERELLSQYPGAVVPDILAGTYSKPISDGRGRNRSNRRKAISLIKSAGFQLVDGFFRHSATGRKLGFEITVVSRDHERLVLAFVRSLQRAGIAASVRRVDSAQFQRRLQTYDFDMIPYKWYASLSPGNEQSFYWGAKGVSQVGTRNYMGASEPAIEGMIKAMLAARNRPEFVDAVRGLDRVLMSGFYVVPLFHLAGQWVAHWGRVAHPEKQSLWGMRIDTWWRIKNQE